ncbi:hypothetical protein B0H11DRAFT_2433424 [Mycena galericulata]|nr:hypothetical protein B0H11DRAFT_2433424 [Mycena galericulata]
MPPLTFAYYCSGHGYGHATRVSALACHLLRLSEDGDKPQVQVFIVSSAPSHVFADSLELGAFYRNSFIDPVIVQPLAYRVDRQKSVAGLKSFLDIKDAILHTEQTWLKEIHADCVLSDAAFRWMVAVGIPSILITNFTFDSVYSYLSSTLVDTPVSPPDDSNTLHHHFNALIPDIPVSPGELDPLVEHIHAGYRCADLLLRLPGYIPIPSFAIEPSLPSLGKTRLCVLGRTAVIMRTSPTDRPVPRRIVPIPLLVRSPSPSIYSPAGRSRLLDSIGVPSHLHSSKILIVSFGGQVFRRPSRSGSATPSRRHSREISPAREPNGHGLGVKDMAHGQSPSTPVSARGSCFPHLQIPSALASKPRTSPILSRASDIPTFLTVPPTPDEYDQPYFEEEGRQENTEELLRLLPDASWIAIVCGVSKEQWNAVADGGDSDLPDAFFVAPRDVYMPDLTAASDVLLGKLGYGTVSECVDSCTPFVYVSRPLFIEEHGLRRLLETDGVGVELSRELYEAGDWSGAIEEARQKGRVAKEAKRRDGETGVGVKKRAEEGRELATMIIRWVEKWSH